MALLLARDGLYSVYFTAPRSAQMCPPDDDEDEDEDVVMATTTGPSLSQSCRAGDVVQNVYTPGDLIT